MARLTKKQQDFVREYLVDLNGAAAARRAGYSPKTANRIATENLSKPVIQAAIQRALKARSERTEITADRVVTRLAIEAEGKGPDTTSSARIRALELLGKHLGMFVDLSKVEHSGAIDTNLSALSDDELVALIARLDDLLDGSPDED